MLNSNKIFCCSFFKIIANQIKKLKCSGGKLDQL